MKERAYTKKKVENEIILYSKNNKYFLAVYLYLFMNCSVDGRIETTIETIMNNIDINVSRKSSSNIKEYRAVLALMMEDTEEFSAMIEIQKDIKQVTLDTYNSRFNNKDNKEDNKSNNKENNREFTNDKVGVSINSLEAYNNYTRTVGIYQLTKEDILNPKKIKDSDTIIVNFFYDNSDILSNFTFIEFQEQEYLTNIISWYKMYTGKNLDYCTLIDIYYYIKLQYGRSVNNSTKKTTEISMSTLGKYSGVTMRTALTYVDILEASKMISVTKGTFAPNGNNQSSSFAICDDWRD